MTLGFSASNQYVISLVFEPLLVINLFVTRHYSGAADHTIMKYDMGSVPFSPDRPQHQTEQYRQHSVAILHSLDDWRDDNQFSCQDIIRGVSTHAFRDEIFLSAR